jgi:hypothetical protein
VEAARIPSLWAQRNRGLAAVLCKAIGLIGKWGKFMKRSLTIGVILVLLFVLYFVVANIVSEHIPMVEDVRISGQILSNFEKMAQTNAAFHRPIERRQEQSDWKDKHVEIATSPGRHFTVIHVIGDLDENESNVLKSIVSKLEEDRGRRIDLKIERPMNGTNQP